MKKSCMSFLLLSTIFASYGCQTTTVIPKSKVVTVHSVSAQGIEQPIGLITFTDSKAGLVIKTDLTQLPAGPHGFHIHQNPTCEPDLKDGVAGAALKAGSHYDPKQAGHHAEPTGKGHLGDLPLLEVAANHTAKQQLLAPRLTLADIGQRAVVIHAGGDNYSDIPQPLGGGGARIACGVIQ